MKPEPLPERGQRACRHGRIMDDGRVWCTLLESVCGVSGECSDYSPTIMHWVRKRD